MNVRWWELRVSHPHAQKYRHKTVPFFTSELTQQHIHDHTDLIQNLRTNHKAVWCIDTHTHTHTQYFMCTHTAHTHMTDPDNLLLFMAAPQLSFKYIFHATLPPPHGSKRGGEKGGRQGAAETPFSAGCMSATTSPLPLLSFLFPSYHYTPRFF